MSAETARRAPARDPGPDKGIPEEGVHQQRGKWDNKMEFIFSTTAVMISTGNIFTFPFNFFRSGGVVFFIPYFVLLLFCGFPLFFMETALGQYTSEGGVTAWRKICPMFQGVGIASHVILAYVSISFIVIPAWALFYLFNSFKSPLPWSTCDNVWNTEACITRLSRYANPHLFKPNSSWSFLFNNTTPDYSDSSDTSDTSHNLIPDKSSALEFWTNRALSVSDSMSLTQIRWDLALCLLLAWIICYFCIFKGIKYTGKVVYFTATFPYLMLIIFFIRGITLPGSAEGLKYYLMPGFYKLFEPYVWYDAATQVIFSHPVCIGVLTSLGSYNKYNNNCYRDCMALCCLNIATCFFAGLVVFSLLGFMAAQMEVTVDDVVGGGIGLAFVQLPEILAMLPGSVFWALLFFFSLVLLTLDAQFVCLESLATAITGMFPRLLRRPYGREILVVVIAVVCFLLGLPFVSEGGLIHFTVMDMYGTSAVIMVTIAFFETVVIGWVYGADRFIDNIEDMIGYKPNPVLKYCWLFITPLICVVSLLGAIARDHTGIIHYYSLNVWHKLLGGLLILIPLMCIPVFILIRLCKNPSNMTTPSSDLCQARPHKPVLTLCKRVVSGAQRQRQPNRSLVDTSEKIMMGEPSGVGDH